MAGTTAFSYSVRVLACSNCGAPLEVPRAGGSARCAYCGVELQVGPRDQAVGLTAAAQPSALDEAERFARLRSQVNRADALPDSVSHLVVAGELHPERVEQAEREWRAARAEVGGGGAFPAAERLFHLTVLLSGELARAGQDERQRALLETAMELLEAPRHRQVLRGALAQNAARLGDLVAADEWLEGCNSRSDDLQVDTAWRLSKAHLCTARGDHAGVLQLLGSQLGDVPIAAAETEVCGLFRANALEQTGQPEQAEQQLYTIMRHGERGAAPLVEYLARHPQQGFCPSSFPRAKQRLDSEIAAEGGRHAIVSTSLAGPVFGLLMLGPAALGLLVASIRDLLVVGHAKGWAFLAVGLFLGGLTGLLVRYGIIESLRKRRQQTRLYQSGADAAATVLSILRGGKDESDQLRLWVRPAARPGYEATSPVRLTGSVAERAAAGRSLPAKVDPAERESIAIIWWGAVG